MQYSMDCLDVGYMQMQYEGSESFEDLFNHFLMANYKGI